MSAFVAASATILTARAPILQVRAYGGDCQTMGNIMFFSYLACAAALPFRLAL
ncbi:MAG: hypothetical protein JXB25_07880 [Deltaproteobacteria bacterium]|nr:hypothetical protein [Deltaproteobacteria bacterium]